MAKVISDSLGAKADRGRGVALNSSLSPGHVPVNGDGDQVQDGGGAAENVARGPHVAQLGAQRPLLRHFVDGAQRHHQARNQQVGHGQRQDQVVGHVLQVPLQQNCSYHKHVSCGTNEIISS